VTSEAAAAHLQALVRVALAVFCSRGATGQPLSYRAAQDGLQQSCRRAVLPAVEAASLRAAGAHWPRSQGLADHEVAPYSVWRGCVAPIGGYGITMRFELKYDGGGAGKGGSGTLCVDETKVNEGRIEHTVPNIFSYDDFADVGKDTGEPVTDEYRTPKGEFTGAEIVSVVIELVGSAEHDHKARQDALMAKQ